MFSNWTEYNIKESALWSDTNVKQNMILKKQLDPIKKIYLS